MDATTPRPRRTKRRPSPNDPAGPRTVAANRTRQEHAYQLWLAGTGYAAIAETDDPARPGHKLYADRGAAYNAIMTARERHSGGTENDERVALHDARYEALIESRWLAAVGGDNAALDRIAALMAARERLHGMCAPSRSRVEVLDADLVEEAIRNHQRDIQALEQMSDDEFLQTLGSRR